MKISGFVYPDVNAARSVNLERDRGYSSALANYQITVKACEILKRFSSALNGEKVSAWSLTGPYGMGKSAFANYLIALTRKSTMPEGKLALKKLKEADKELHKNLAHRCDKVTNKKGFYPIPITAAYEPINRTLVRGFARALNNGHEKKRGPKPYKALRPELERLSRQELPDTKRLAEMISSLGGKSQQPIIIVIDEFGKNLEYMAHHPDKGDIFIMQMLAEMENIYLWVCLHQSFEAYAAGLTSQQRQEWNKVQGRFEDISFVESTSQMLALIRRVLIKKESSDVSRLVKKWANSIESECRSINIPFLQDMTSDAIASLYPLHPISAIVLPELCRRFAQNDRTLFSFLCSGDPHSLPEYLQTHEIKEKRLPSLGLDYLYDYFFSVSTTAFINRPEAQRWVEIQNIIGQAHSLSPISQSILKTVGVLNLISGPSGIQATLQVLRLALLEPLGIDQNTLDAEIDVLSKKNILIFRAYANEYRLWEGSDLDLIGAIHEKKATLATRPLAETLQHYCPLVPMIASRHSYETGTLRSIECRWMSVDELTDEELESKPGYDGTLVFSFGKRKTIQRIPSHSAEGRPLVIAYTGHEDQIKELVLEAAATRAVLDETPELLHDGVARKEARFRVQAAEDQLRDYIGRIYDPKEGDAAWYAAGESCSVKSYRDLSSLISELCDKAYAHCPRIGNEMINGEQLSTAAARARRELAEAMVSKEEKEQLGLSGYGPEVAVYRSLFRFTELHAETDGQWKFVRPDAMKHRKIATVWKELDAILQEKHDAPDGVSVRILIDRLKKPPFGLREGPISLLLCHYLIVNADETALYQEGSYRPYFGEAEIALMIKRPELFSVRRYAPTGLNRDVVQAYMQVLDTGVLQLDERARNSSMLRIITPLLRFMEALPQYTRFTRSVSLAAQKIRGVVLNAREPIQLLFRDIPEAVGLEPVYDKAHVDEGWKEHLRENLLEALLELQRAYDRLNADVQRTLMEAFGEPYSIESFSIFRKNIQFQYSSIVTACRDEQLRPIIGAFSNNCDDDEEWARGVAGQVVRKPLETWRDNDREPFRILMMEVTQRILALKDLVAAGAGTNSDQSVVVTVTRSDGRTQRRIVKLEEEARATLKMNFPNIFDLSLSDRASLCALIFETLEENS